MSDTGTFDNAGPPAVTMDAIRDAVTKLAAVREAAAKMVALDLAERRVPFGIALEDAAAGQPVKVLVTAGMGGWR